MVAGLGPRPRLVGVGVLHPLKLDANALITRRDCSASANGCLQGRDDALMELDKRRGGRSLAGCACLCSGAGRDLLAIRFGVQQEE